MSRRGRKHRTTDVFNLSFLDVISVGFGAVILLIVITKIHEPQLREEATEQSEARIERLQQRLEDISSDTEQVSQKLSSTESELESERQRVASLRAELERIRSVAEDAEEAAQAAERLEARLQRARQELTEEMERLLEDYRPPREAPVGGIPIDSEYIVFVIDTSPSMTQYTWGRMINIMEQILDTYPTVKGMQVMNDMGTYLLSRYAGEWIQDTPALRQAVIRALRNWRPFSNSSPVEGVSLAARTFGPRQDTVSIYYLGDEMQGQNLHHAAVQIQRANTGRDGETMARIHSIGFPVIYDFTGSVQATGLRFATLMRIVAELNKGTFVALHSGRGR